MSEVGLLFDRFDILSRPLLQGLINCFWQGLVIAALVRLLMCAMKRSSATTRHAVWMITLLTIGVLPLISIATVTDNPSRVNPAGDRASKSSDQFRLAPPIVNPLPIPPDIPARTREKFDRLPEAVEVNGTSRFVTLNETSRVVPQNSDQIVKPAATIIGGNGAATGRRWADLAMPGFYERIPAVLVVLWLIGCALMMARILKSYLSLIRLRRGLIPVPAEIRDKVEQLAMTMGVERLVEIYGSRNISIPMTMGAFRPLIVIPADIAQSLSGSEFESVIAHELAHIKRWDYLTNLTQRVIQSCLFFHPAVWYIGNQLMIERELACDDWAVKTCEPRRYARCLTKLVELISESKPFIAAAGILFGKHVISRRVEMILNRERNATTAVSKPALAYAVGLAVLFLFVCSSISPVIAVPLAQNREQKQQTKKQAKSPASPTKSQDAPVPPSPPSPAALPALPEIVEIPEPPDAPEPPVIVGEIDEIAAPSDGLTIIGTPVAVSGGIGRGIGGGIGVGGISTNGFGVTSVAPVAVGIGRSYGIAPRQNIATTAPIWVQDEKGKAPAISESELLNVLTDIVKRDADPQVRREALQGIYRMRSDAAINSLIQLYDASSDVKVKGEILGYLIRRDGDNSKAISKLMSIAKSEQNEELRGRAIRSLGGVRTEEGANNLIQIYDGLQDSKMKQTVIRYLAFNKTRKAIDKLIQIAKSDSDPVVRQSAIRSLYGVDGRLYLDLVDKARIGMVGDEWRLEGFDSRKFNEEFQKKWEQEFPRLEMKLKDLENNFEFELTPEFKSLREKQRTLEREKRELKRSEPTPEPKPAKPGTAF